VLFHADLDGSLTAPLVQESVHDATPLPIDGPGGDVIMRFTVQARTGKKPRRVRPKKDLALRMAVAGTRRTVTDGPFAELKELLGVVGARGRVVVPERNGVF
jgi:hypothetical protein